MFCIDGNERAGSRGVANKAHSPQQSKNLADSQLFLVSNKERINRCQKNELLKSVAERKTAAGDDVDDGERYHDDDAGRKGSVRDTGWYRLRSGEMVCTLAWSFDQRKQTKLSTMDREGKVKRRSPLPGRRLEVHEGSAVTAISLSITKPTKEKGANRPPQRHNQISSHRRPGGGAGVIPDGAPKSSNS